MGSIIPYFGGKSRLAKTIIKKIPKHTCYVEVFAGGASVFFAKDPSKTEVLNDLELAWQRLAHVQIESKYFRDLIPRYDRPHTLFFLDPPYWKIPGYKHDFEEQDFLDLANLLYNIRGKFIMTLNDAPEVRVFFRRFNIETVELKYSIATAKNSRSKTRTELLISNYKLP